MYKHFYFWFFFKKNFAGLRPCVLRGIVGGLGGVFGRVGHISMLGNKLVRRLKKKTLDWGGWGRAGGGKIRIPGCFEQEIRLRTF